MKTSNKLIQVAAVQAGDDVYVVTDREAFNAAGGLDEAEEVEVCEKCHERSRGKAPMLECSGCARGFHTTCVKLKAVPEVGSSRQHMHEQLIIWSIMRSIITAIINPIVWSIVTSIVSHTALAVTAPLPSCRDPLS